MTDRDRNTDRPLEESPEMAAAADDDTTVPQLVTGGGPDDETPAFVAPGETPVENGTDDLVGDAYAGTSGEGRTTIRTGAEQPWEAEDLAVARGQDPDPENVERARRDLEREGPAAVERTLP